MKSSAEAKSKPTFQLRQTITSSNITDFMFILIRINVNICSWINFIFPSKVFHCFTERGILLLPNINSRMRFYDSLFFLVTPTKIYCLNDKRERKVKNQNSYYGKYRENFSRRDTEKMVLRWFNLNKFPLMSHP